jgi:hypothetical protein
MNPITFGHKAKKHSIGQRHSFLSNPQLWIFIAAIIIVAISLMNHEPWLDEAEAPNRIYSWGWNLWHLMESFRGDGHFPLYHTLLFPFLNIGRLLNIDAFSIVKFFTFIQYSFFAFLVCSWIRFPYSGFLLFSYYSIYEYGSISRCYLLAMIFCFIILRSLVANKENKILSSTAFFFFPLTHSLSMIFSVPIYAYLIFKRQWSKVGLLTASFIVCLYYLSIRDTQDPFSQFPYLRQEDTRGLLDYAYGFVNSLLSAWFPFSSADNWWNHSFASDMSIWGLPILLGLVFLAITRAHYEKPLLTFTLLLGSFLCLAILLAKYPTGSFRHIGYATWPFLCFLSLLMFGENELEQGVQQSIVGNLSENSSILKLTFLRITSYAAIALLSFNIFSGLTSVYKDVVQVFDGSVLQLNSINEAQNISEEKMQIFAQPCWSFWPIAALSNWSYVSSPLWFPDGELCSVGTETLEEISFPDTFFLYTWGVYSLENRNPLPELSNVSLRRFLRYKKRRCQELNFVEKLQTFPSHLYDCKSTQ